MADSVESKQNFLTNEIIAKGFDPDDFTKWIDETYPNGRLCSLGCDLDKWMYDDLEKAVREYQCSRVPIFAQEMSTPTSPEKSSPTTVSEKAEVSSLRSMSIPVHNELPRKLSFCNKSRTERKKVLESTCMWARRFLWSRVIQEKKSFFTFSSKFVFTLNTDPHGWEVQRKLEDFKWLSQRLKFEFPSAGVESSNKIQEFDGKDREDIESYMNYILNEDVCLHSRFLVFFLSCTNQTKFDAKREKEFNKYKKGDKWLSGHSKKHHQEEIKKESEDRMFSKTEAQNPEDNINQFLEEAGPNIIECQKLYKE